MSLSERLTAAKPSQRGLPCPISVILSQLDEDDAHSLERAMRVPKDDPGRLSAVKIAEALRLEGWPIHPKSVENHRKGACRCVAARTPTT